MAGRHAERFAFLATAGEVLASSLDLDRTLQEIAGLAVPLLGDLCILDIVEDRGLRRVATAHVDPQKAELLETLRERYPASRESPHPAGRVLVSGQPELLERVTSEVVASHTQDSEHAALIRAIGIRSHLAVPLVARGSTIGVISLGISESDRTYRSEDVSFLQEIARRAALAIDNARLYELAQAELAERRRVEEALRISEERFRAIIEQSPLSTQILAPDGTTVRVNRAWERLWGFNLDQLTGYNILEDPQLEGPGTAALLRRAFAGEAVHLPAIHYDPNQTIPDGSLHSDPARWVRAFAYPVKDDHGTVREVVLVHEDVTETRSREDALRGSEERLRLALTASRMNVWDWDLLTDIVSCSENAREFWGMEIGKASDFISVIHREDVPHVAQAARSAIAGEKPYFSEYRLAPRGGMVRWVQSRGRVERSASGDAVRILGVTLDITDLKEAEQRTQLLADAGAALGGPLDYHATLRNLARLVVPRLGDWCAVDLLADNGSLERAAVHHRDPARVAEAHEVYARFPPHPDDAHGSWRVIRTGQAEWVPEVSDALLEEAAHGPEHLALLRRLQLRSFIAVPLIARRQPIGVLTIVYAESGRRYESADVELATDIARRAAAAVDNARLYQRLRAEERRKDEFLATLAHELRNPLAPIRTGLALLRDTSAGPMAERTRQIMERQVEHMVRLIDDLLDLSRVTRGAIQLQKEQTDLLSILGTAVETSRPILDAAGVQFIVRVPEEPVVIEVDRTRVAQILSNILNNAAKFTARDGRVELTAGVEGSNLLVSVTDTGAGIAPEMLGQVFELFVQVRDARVGGQPGLGIGLTLVKRLVELHGGRVWAQSDGIGKGSSFFVSLPLAPAAAPAERRPQQHSPTEATSPRRVLVVDDNQDAAEMLAHLLTLSGHQVRTAGSGPEALEIARGFHPHVALLDLGLPGMSGYDLARHLRREPQFGGTRLIAVTGWGQAEDRRRSKQAGFDDHLTKPVEPAAVLAIVAAS